MPKDPTKQMVSTLKIPSTDELKLPKIGLVYWNIGSSKENVCKIPYINDPPVKNKQAQVSQNKVTLSSTFQFC